MQIWLTRLRATTRKSPFRPEIDESQISRITASSATATITPEIRASCVSVRSATNPTCSTSCSRSIGSLDTLMTVVGSNCCHLSCAPVPNSHSSVVEHSGNRSHRSWAYLLLCRIKFCPTDRVLLNRCEHQRYGRTRSGGFVRIITISPAHRRRERDGRFSSPPHMSIHQPPTPRRGTCPKASDRILQPEGLGAMPRVRLRFDRPPGTNEPRLSPDRSRPPRHQKSRIPRRPRCMYPLPPLRRAD